MTDQQLLKGVFLDIIVVKLIITISVVLSSNEFSLSSTNHRTLTKNNYFSFPIFSHNQNFHSSEIK